jgi:predicted  nucleic acid-binding Zn-ribbon protein
VTEVIIKDQIKKLVDLQKIDTDIYIIRTELKEKPELIKALEDDFEKEKKQLKELEDSLKHLLVKRKEAELELKVKEEAISKANGALSMLKTNKEYSAKLSEIESIKADKSIIEDGILRIYEESDTIQTEINKEKTIVSEKEKGFQTKKKQLDDEIRILEDKLKVLEAQRQQYLTGIDKALLSKYEKILNHKEGLAIVPIRGTTCGGCFMNLTTQLVNVIKVQSELVECEWCARILYLEDSL